jgi:hypothetical protein
MSPEIKKLLMGALTIAVGVALVEVVKAMFLDDVTAKIRAKKETGSFEVL